MLVEQSKEIWLEELRIAKEHFKIADHMSYVTFVLLKEKRLLVKILVELAEAVSHLIKAFLYYESAWKRVRLYRDPRMNLKTFQEKIALRYMGKGCFEDLIKILEIKKKHKDAGIEFVRKDKFVILLGDEYATLDIDKVKGFLRVVREGLESFPEKK